MSLLRKAESGFRVGILGVPLTSGTAVGKLHSPLVPQLTSL